MKDIKDYLHLYLGQEVYYKHKEPNGQINIYKNSFIWKIYAIHTFPDSTELEANLWNNGGCKLVSVKDFKLILRPLSDMTVKEIKQIQELMPLSPNSCITDSWVERNSPYWKYEANRTYYLLKQGFDIFGLIEAGLAIDKTKLKP